MKQKVSPIAVIAIVVVLLGGLGFAVYSALTGHSDGKPVVVKPDNPNDPKFKVDSKLGLGGT